MAKTKRNDSIINTTLVNALSPTALKFDKDGFDLGELYCIGSSVTRFPTKASYEWMTEVCNLSSTMTSITYTPEQSPEVILKAIGNMVSASELTANGVTNSDPVERARAQKIVADGQKIIEQIANNNESIGQVAINVLTIGNSRTDALLKAKATKNKFGGRMFNLTNLPFMQKEVFKGTSPCDVAPPLLDDVSNQLLPISTLLGGFPFAFAGYNDGIGCYWGKDSGGSLIIIDAWKRGLDRTNSSLVAMGGTGAGKSTAIKHLLLNEWEIGTKIIVIDPHGEYKEMCNNLEGDWINAVGGSNSRINPFHIYTKLKDDESEKSKEDVNIKNEETLSELALHINNLEVFFKLYLDLSPLLVATLKECLEDVYRQKGITWKTDVAKLKAEQYPIMNDLYETCLAKAEVNKKVIRDSETNHYQDLALLVRCIAVGSDSFIWNGESTVDAKNGFTVFDTSAVNSNADNVKTALYHTILNYCEDYLYRNRNERVILVCDEAHNVIDKRLPATVARLANIEKSVRKFESAIWICSQQLIDFLDEAIRAQGQTLLDQPNIKLLMSVGKGKDLKELKELYNLTDAEEERLMQQQRGKGLLFIGSRRITVDFEISQHHLALMGTGGGR